MCSVLQHLQSGCTESCILIGHLDLAAWDQKGFLFPAACRAIAWAQGSAIVGGVEVIPYGRNEGFAIPPHLPQQHNGCAHHQRECDQPQGEGQGQSRRENTSHRGRGLLGGFGKLTAGSHEVGWALAHWPTEVSETRATILAGALGANICTDMAVLAGVSERTCTCVIVNSINAGTSVAARVAGALVNVDLTAGASKARPALTLDATPEV